MYFYGNLHQHHYHDSQMKPVLPNSISKQSFKHHINTCRGNMCEHQRFIFLCKIEGCLGQPNLRSVEYGQREKGVVFKGSET